MDASGLTSDPIKIMVWQSSSHLGPVILDLDGSDSLDLVSLHQSRIAVDMNSDGIKDVTGWIGSQDGLLALDRNHNGTIDNGSEISFMSDVPGAASDLEGLRAYDSNGNGSLDSGDRRYAEFKVWRDADQDGVSRAEELWSLPDLNIASIDLAGNKTGLNPDQSFDNTVYATSSYRRTDGSTGAVGDVFLAYFDGATEGRNNSGSHTGGALPPANESPAPGDRGPGDAAPGKVRRDAQRNLAPARMIADTMRDQTWHAKAPRSAADAPPASQSAEAAQTTLAQQPVRMRGDDEPLRQAEAASDEEDGNGAAVMARSALHDQLALSQKKRFQMIEAMSAFSADPYAEFGLGAGKGPKTVELLTALPDFRMSA